MVRGALPAITQWLCLRTLTQKSPPTKKGGQARHCKTGGQARNRKTGRQAVLSEKSEPRRAADLKVQRIIVKK